MSFFLDTTPIELFFLYLEDFKNWTKSDVDPPFYYYNDVPEFNLTQLYEKYEPNFSEPWTKKMDFPPDAPVGRSTYQLKYHTTLIDNVDILFVDGKHEIPMPKIRSALGGSPFYFSRSSLEYKVAKLLAFNRSNSLGSILALTNLPIED
jgi:hypothetical protein